MKEYTGQPMNELLAANDVVLIQYYAEWCNPCQMLKPILEELSTEIDNVEFLRVDIEEYRELAVEANVQSIPTVVMFKDGKEVGREKGFKPKHLMETWIKNNA